MSRVTVKAQGLACSICHAPATEANLKQFEAHAPQVGKKLTFKICPACQVKAQTQELHICLGCVASGDREGALSWHPLTVEYTHDIHHRVKSQCPKCLVKNIEKEFLVPI